MYIYIYVRCISFVDAEAQVCCWFFPFYSINQSGDVGPPGPRPGNSGSRRLVSCTALTSSQLSGETARTAGQMTSRAARNAMCRRNGAVQVWHVEVWCYWHPRRSQMIKDSCPAVWLDNQSLYYITNSQIHSLCLKWRIFGNHRQAKSSLPLLKWCDHATWCYTHLWRRTTENHLQLAMATSARCPPHLPKQIHRFYLSGKKWNEWCSSPLLGKQDAKCYHMNLVPGLHWNYHLPFGNTPQLDWKAFPKCYRWYLHGSSLEKHAACCRCKFTSNKGSSHPSHIVRYVPITSNYIALYPTTSTKSPSYLHYLPINAVESRTN